MSRPGTYIPFELCVCGKNKKSIHQASDKKYYYGCGNCGRTSIRFRRDSEYQAKLGWNEYIKSEREKNIYL